VPASPTVMAVAEARKLSIVAHGEQRERDASLHIDHVPRVVDHVPPSARYRRVAWLHDVLEDSDTDIEQLRQRLATVEVEALLLLTHDG
jgi:(p)ppGpp synthase/HD superfamily hydrolase